MKSVEVRSFTLLDHMMIPYGAKPMICSPMTTARQSSSNNFVLKAVLVSLRRVDSNGPSP